MKYSTVLLKNQDNTTIITLNRPESFNALDFQLCEDLMSALEVCGTDARVRAVVITGAGKAFCSGGDLKSAQAYLGEDPAEPYRQLTKPLNRIIMEIRNMKKPVIAAINGAVGGAGLSIAAACDLRIASSKAKFKQAYTTVGLAPDGAWTLLVPLLIGFGKASELLFLDPVVDAEKALEIGLVNQVVGPDELESEVLNLAGKISKGPTRSFAIIKERINNAMLSLLERQLELERQGIIEAAGTRDYVEGINSFFEKRVPQFRGE